MTVSNPLPSQEPPAPVTLGMISSLRRARPWILLLALCGFLCMALAGAAAFSSWIHLHRYFAGALQGGIATVCLLGALRLFLFARAVKRIRQGAGVAPVEEALEHQLTLLRGFGFGLLFVLALVALVGGLAAYSLIPFLPLQGEGPPPAFESIDEACSAQGTESVCGTIARFDPQGKLLFWTGWQTREGDLQMSSLEDGGVAVRFGDAFSDPWGVTVRPPAGRVLRRGEYTGANSGHTQEERARAGELEVRSPRAWFPPESGRKDPEWRGSCYPLGKDARFTVREILWSRAGEARRVSLDFELPCSASDGTWLVLGRVRAALPGS